MSPQSLPAALQRGDGAAQIGFISRGQGTVLRDLYHRSPCRVLFPNPVPGDLVQAVLVTTSGGLAGGDRIAIAVGVGIGAAATVTAQAAEKIYRSLGPATRVTVSLDVAEAAWLEWLPQETILFRGARLERRTEARVAVDGRLLAAEILVFGRLARGERFEHGLLHDGWRIRRDGRLVWADALHLDGDIAALVDAPSGFAGAEAFGTALYVGADAGSLLEAARALAERSAEGAGAMRLGLTVVDGVLLARWLGDATAVRRAMTGFLGEFRAAAAGLPARLPQVWYS